MENHKAGFPPFPLLLEIPSGFPHSQRFGGERYFNKTGPSQAIPRTRATFPARAL